MPGLCGLTSTMPRTDHSAKLEEMAGRLKHHPWYVEHRHLDVPSGIALGRVSLGFINTAAQPAYNEDRSLLAMMEGEVYEYPEQRRILASAGHRFRGDSHAELLLHGYESQGKDFFRGLHGTFVAAIWDIRERRLILTCDRFGMKPIYYAQLPGEFLFASEIKALLANPGLSRTTDPRAIAQFFAFGQLLGEDTFLRAVRVLPGAGWLSYQAGEERLTLDRYWRPEAGHAGDRPDPPEILDRIDEAFKRAVDRRVTGTNRLGLSLSGGLDSRTILAAIDHEQVPITTVSMGIVGSIDHRSAEQMAALVNCPHHFHRLDETFLDRFEEHMNRMVHLTDGHHLSQCVATPTLPTYRALGIEVLLRGHAGELMHMDKAYNYSLDREAFAIRDEADLESWLSGHLRAFLLDKTSGPLFARTFEGAFEDLARDSLRACLRESEGFDPPTQRIWHLFLTQRLRRETALSMAEFGSLVETRLPYLDHDLIETLIAAPPGLKLSDTIQAHILRRRMPAFLDVVNANTGTRLGAGPVAGALAKARLKVLGKLRVRGYQPYERLGLWLRRQLRPLVERLLLDDRSLGRGIFDPMTVKAVVEAHLDGRCNHTFLIMALMIFEVGQREFIDGDGHSSAPCFGEPDPRTARTASLISS